MKQCRFWRAGLVVSVVLLLLLSWEVGFAEDKLPDPLVLVRSAETQYLGDTSRAVARMVIKTTDWTRELEMEFWGEDRDKMLARIRQPARERGVSTLKTDDRLWNYVPKIDRVIRIPPGLMGEAWMGSHMTNDDLVKAHKIDELYDLKTESVENGIAVIRAVPKETAAVVWGAVVYYVELERKVPVRILYFDEEEKLVRTMHFENLRQMPDKRWVPMLVRVVPEDKPAESTVIEYLELEMNIDLPRDIFSLAGLRRKR